MTRERDHSERIAHLEDGDILQLLESINPEITLNEVKQLLNKVNQIAHENGLPTNFRLDDEPGDTQG